MTPRKPSEKYTVNIGESVYSTNSKAVLNGILDVASQQVRNGVYAAKKGNTYILLNEPELSREQFREMTKAYNKMGFILLHNRGVAHG